MIRKSRYRFSDNIMPKCEAGGPRMIQSQRTLAGRAPLHCVQHNILLAEFETRFGPRTDVVAKRLSSLCPFVAIDATVGLRDAVVTACRKQAQAVEAIALDHLLECLE